MRNVTFAAAALAALSLFGEGRHRVLSEDAPAAWFRRFAADDEELYTNAICNADAFAAMQNIMPRFECPDADIVRTWYFRWWTYRKHLRKTHDGWVVTEFLPDVSWAGKHNTIVCPAGHHLREGRWLANPGIAADLARFWLASTNSTHRWNYSSWLMTGVRGIVEVTGDEKLATGLLDAAVEYYCGWEKGRTHLTYPEREKFRMGGDGKGLFTSIDDREGSEMSLGGNGYRPLMNAAMWSEAKSIAWAARLAGREDLAVEFETKAATTEQGIKDKLWNPERNFFTTLSLGGRKGTVCELHGYAPWYFGMKLDGFEKAWPLIDDERGFAAPFGLTFPERIAPGFKVVYEGHACQWNGPSWPFATSIALTALANHLQSATTACQPQTFNMLLHQYAAAQVRTLEDGRKIPWIDENMDPFTGEWIARKVLESANKGTPRYITERGKDYNHSTFCDIVITGLCGLIPRTDGRVELKPLASADWDWWCLDGVRYHGRDITVIFDRNGTRYGKGKGLVVLPRGERT